jgi:hypothetical protein
MIRIHKRTQLLQLTNSNNIHLAPQTTLREAHCARICKSNSKIQTAQIPAYPTNPSTTTSHVGASANMALPDDSKVLSDEQYHKHRLTQVSQAAIGMRVTNDASQTAAADDA